MNMYHGNIVESEKTVARNPSKPSSQSSSSSCMKAKMSSFSLEGRDTREWVVQLMSSMKGAQDPSLIFETTLSAADVNPSQSRLLIPFNRLIRHGFLSPDESRIMEEDINNNENMGVGAVLVDPRTEKWGVIIIMKNPGGSLNYALACGWNDIVKANGLKEGHKISVWSFRCRGILCFALVPLPM